jgi:hypothetical protein
MSSDENWDKYGGMLDLRPGAEDFGIRRQAVSHRLSDPPKARATYFSGSVFLVTKAVERACHIDSMMLIHKQFFYQTVGEDGEVITTLRHGAFLFLYNPLSGIIRTLKSIESDVNRYAWLIKRLKIVGNSELSEHSPSPSWIPRHFSLLIQLSSRDAFGFQRTHRRREALSIKALLGPL